MHLLSSVLFTEGFERYSSHLVEFLDLWDALADFLVFSVLDNEG